mmetsp:Transcript_3884/g.9896  ORF Transcript_3884/g.9896 Transcript_3884/m.9896 type:complete len:245 (-) Transcript_3884:209-943(-)
MCAVSWRIEFFMRASDFSMAGKQQQQLINDQGPAQHQHGMSEHMQRGAMSSPLAQHSQQAGSHSLQPPQHISGPRVGLVSQVHAMQAKIRRGIPMQLMDTHPQGNVGWHLQQQPLPGRVLDAKSFPCLSFSVKSRTSPPLQSPMQARHRAQHRVVPGEMTPAFWPLRYIDMCVRQQQQKQQRAFLKRWKRTWSPVSLSTMSMNPGPGGVWQGHRLQQRGLVQQVSQQVQAGPNTVAQKPVSGME